MKSCLHRGDRNQDTAWVTKAMTHHVTVVPLIYPESSAISHTSTVFYLMPMPNTSKEKGEGGGRAVEPKARVAMM